MQTMKAGTNGADRASISSLKNGMWFVDNDCSNFPGNWCIILKVGGGSSSSDFAAICFVQPSGGVYYCQGNFSVFTGWKSLS